jgi:hypothetical protein
MTHRLSPPPPPPEQNTKNIKRKIREQGYSTCSVCLGKFKNLENHRKCPGYENPFKNRSKTVEFRSDC